jgi:hypothetical protein
VPLRTFAPGVATAAEAVPLPVGVGQDITGFTVRVRVGETHRIRGRLFGSVGSQDHGAVVVVPADEEQTSLALSSAGLNPDGSFDFPGLSPGRYVLKYFTVSGDSARSGETTVELSDHDANDVALSIAMPITIRGQIRVEAATDQAAADQQFQKFQLMLVTADALVGPGASAAIAADGAFSFSNVMPGRYAVRTVAPSGAYLKAVHYGPLDGVDKVLDLTGGAPGGEMEVVYRYGVAALSGSIARESSPSDGKPVTTAAQIVLIPRTRVPSPAGDDLLFTTSDAANGFSFKNLRPDHYLAFAFDSVDFAILREPPSLKALESVGTEVEVGEGEQKSVSLRPVSAEEVQGRLRSARSE